MSFSIQPFVRSRAGNFSLIFAVSSLPLLMAGGIAVDFAALSSTKATLQQAMDSAALAIAREGKTVTQDRATSIAMTFVDQNFDPDYINLKIARNDTAVSVAATTRAPLAFGSLFGYQTWPIEVVSAADIAYASYEIALVLDTTGSMKGGKLASMKDAVGGLIETMSAQVSDKDRLKFSVVPFSNFVNVGPQFGPKFDSKGRVIPGSAAAWLDTAGANPADQSELAAGVSRFELIHNLGQTWSGCVETRPLSGKTDHGTSDTPAAGSDKASLFMPAFSIDEPSGWNYGNDYISASVDPTDESQGARVAKLAKYGVPEADILSALGLPKKPGAGTTWKPLHVGSSPGPNASCVTQPIMPLGNDYKAIVAEIDGLQANGNTNIMEGVAWGMRSLSPEAPFTEGTDSSKSLAAEKMMIVLTDGANVFGNRGNALGSSYASFGYLTDGRLGISSGSADDTNAAMNEKTLAVCEAAKKDGMVVYTIRLEEPDVETGYMLKECASGPDHFFDAPSRSQLDDVFKAIRDRIIRVRISS